MTQFIGKKCPYCQSVILNLNNCYVCSKCQIPHHKDCWEDNGGCTTFGCDGNPANANMNTGETVVTDISFNSNEVAYKQDGRYIRYNNCPSCGRQNDAQMAFCPGCGARLQGNTNNNIYASGQKNINNPGYAKSQQYQSPYQTADTYRSSMNYAGFWKRFVAIIIDSIILFLGILVITLVSGTSKEDVFINIISILVGWLYYALMESSSKQATLGKMAIGIYVTDLGGSKISFGKASGRYFGKIISGLFLLIGYIMAGFTERKQALHDRMAGCLVLSK